MHERQPTRSQRQLMAQLDQGISIEQIAETLGKSVIAVKQQVSRLRRCVREGRIAPAPLPIEVAAAEPRVYLAGFDVFRADAKERGEYLKQLCRQRGFVGLYPLDSALPTALEPRVAAHWIYTTNTKLIQSADIVMANLDDFRGPGEPDSGTAFEVGYAVALGKPVWAYRSDPATLMERVEVASTRKDGGLCRNGYAIEDFGLSVNLMLACSAQIVVGDPAECLDRIVAGLMTGTPASGGLGLAKR